MSSSSGPPPPGDSQQGSGQKTTRSTAGGASFKRKFAAVNRRLLAGTISVEDAEAINAFEGKFEVDPATNQLVRKASLIPVTSAGRPVYPNVTPVSPSASASSSPYSGAAYTPRPAFPGATIPEDRIIPGVPRFTVPSQSPEIVQDRLAPQAGATPKGTKAPRLVATPKVAPKLTVQRTFTPASKRSVSFQEDSLRPSSPPEQSSSTAGSSSQLPASSSSSGTVAAAATEPADIGLPFIALDLHNTLDDGSRQGRIPEPHVAACRQLLSKGLGIWVCSYIGRTGPNSQQIRTDAENHCKVLSKKLDLRFEDSHRDGPEAGKLFFLIVNRKNYARLPNLQGYLNGKVSSLLHFNTKVLIDDNLDIASECGSHGILVYHLSTSRPNDSYRPRALWDIGFSSHTFPSFESATYQILNDLYTGDLQRKLRALDAVAQRLEVPTYAGV